MVVKRYVRHVESLVIGRSRCSGAVDHRTTEGLDEVHRRVDLMR